MVRVGLIGLGFMGRMHYQTYQKISGAQVVAIADADEQRAAGDLSGGWGNIDGAEGVSHLPMDQIRGTTDFHELIGWEEVDLVDICVPTPAHVDLAVAALQSGKHVLCEKPLARTSAEAQIIADAAASAKGMFMPAMCMRFWPQWAWLKQAVEDKRYGKVLAATFRRVATMPAGWFRDGKLSGGALLDLHIHDTDFIHHLFGKPTAVVSSGYTRGTGEIDHIVTQYEYTDGGPELVYAEGGWTLADGSAFSMRYTVNFEQATADFDLMRDDPLLLSQDGKLEPVTLEGFDDGYHGELAYFIDCVKQNRPPQVVTVSDAVASIQIAEAEGRSATTRQRIAL